MDQKQRSIADKYSLDYYRRSLPTRSWKWPWNTAALVLAVLVVVSMYLIGRNTTFQAAPVAGAHSSFGTSCASCHDQNWAAARRLVQFSDVHHSVSDAACQACHQAAPHATAPLKEPACAACHQEHRPDNRLVDLADGACVRCHRDLNATGISQASFASHIGGFEEGVAGHPEFAVLRPNDDSVGSRHEARSLARFVKLGQGTGQWRDRSGLKFNHRVHLDPAGVLNPQRAQTKLACADCHANDPDSGYMRPIQYEQHCAHCHPLSVSTPLAALGQLPHSSVEQVRGVLRERIAQQMEKSSAQSTALAGQGRPPGLPRPARLSADQERELSTQMELADHAVFGFEAKGMCRRCHHVVQRDEQWHVLLESPTVADDAGVTSMDPAAEMVPSRWMPHARFNHKSHRAVACGECHPAETSSETADILMPSIAMCRTCHGDSTRVPSMRVRADCVLCHTYHDDRHAAPFEGVPLERLFPQSSSASATAFTP